MARYTKSDLIESQIDPALIDRAEAVLLSIKNKRENEYQVVVFSFYKAPKCLQKVCCFNGGDEDWMIILWQEFEWTPRWIEKTDSCEDPDIYIFGNAIIYIGSHA